MPAEVRASSQVRLGLGQGAGSLLGKWIDSGCWCREDQTGGREEGLLGFAYPGPALCPDLEVSSLFVHRLGPVRHCLPAPSPSKPLDPPSLEHLHRAVIQRERAKNMMVEVSGNPEVVSILRSVVSNWSFEPCGSWEDWTGLEAE